MNNRSLAGLSWLQLSDLHVFSETDTDLMVKAFEKLATKIHPNFIIVTGDYRHLGKKDESTFALAKKYLETIIGLFNIPKEYVYLVPGNHDVATAEDQEYTRKGIITEITKNIDQKYTYYERFLPRKRNGFTLDSAFEEYKQFVASFYSGSTVEDERVSNPSGVFLSKYKSLINILHINTALISDDERNEDDSRGHSEIVDINAISEISRKLESNIPAIVIGHHDLKDLYPKHKERLEILLHQYYSAYLHGDIHKCDNKPIRCENPNEVCPAISCGKSCPQDGDNYSDVGVIYYQCREDSRIEVKAFKCDQYGFRWNNDPGFAHDIDELYEFPLRYKKDNDYEEQYDAQDEKKILLGYIINKEKTCELEASVGNYPKYKNTQPDDIYIQSYRFILETDDLFQQVIIWNLRKGAKYHYLIPEDTTSQDEFCKAVRDWYNHYAEPLDSSEKFFAFIENIKKPYKGTQYHFDKYWSKTFDDMVQSVRAIWESAPQKQTSKIKRLRKRSIDAFLELLEVSVIDPKYFYITTALYEIKDPTGKQRKWKAIIKLPTVKLEKEYHAFKVYGESSGTDQFEFVGKFKKLYEDSEATSRGNEIKEMIRDNLYDLYKIQKKEQAKQ